MKLLLGAFQEATSALSEQYDHMGRPLTEIS